MSKKIGRPLVYEFPMKCVYCSISLDNSRSLWHHKNRVKYCPGSKSYEMSAEKRIKGEKSYALVPFNPNLGISPSLKATLTFIENFIQQETESAEARNFNVEQYILDGIHVCFRKCSPEDLNKLKGFLSEKQLEFIGKQESVKQTVDTLVGQCEMVVGRQPYESLLGSPPHYQISMEKLLINHIRQRSLEQLHQSDIMLDAFILAVKQTNIFRQAEVEMGQYLYIESLIDRYLKSLPHAGFINEPGRMNSQAQDDGSNIEDGSTINEN